MQELQNLVKSPGWELLAREMDQMFHDRVGVVLLTPTTLEMVLPAEFLKGEGASAHYWRNRPFQMIDEYQALVDMLKQTSELEDDDDGEA